MAYLYITRVKIQEKQKSRVITQAINCCQVFVARHQFHQQVFSKTKFLEHRIQTKSFGRF